MRIKIFFIILFIIITTLVVYSNDGITGHKMLGWTADGKIIAFELEEYIDAIPLDKTRVIVINLVDDKILEDTEISQTIAGDDSPIKSEVDRKRDSIIRKYNIVRSNQQMSSFPFKWNNDEYSKSLELFRSSNNGITTITGYMLNIFTNNRGFKLVSEDDNLNIHQIKVLGLYAHPSQPRMCILLEFKSRTYPEDVNFMTVSYKFIGCHLTYGYEEGQ